MSGIVKTFPGVRALDGVDLEVRAGEVHCLLGQNGAGKSTLIKVLAGAHQPDEGEIIWRGRPTTLGSPVAALQPRHRDDVPGAGPRRRPLGGGEHLPRPRARDVRLPAAARGCATRPATLMRRLGHPEIPPGREVGLLSAAGQQLVSMARALVHDARLIVMDEPTAALAADEVDNLFRIVEELTAEGVAVVYISHRLEEIRRIGAPGHRAQGRPHGRDRTSTRATRPTDRAGEPHVRPHGGDRVPAAARCPLWTRRTRCCGSRG